MTYMAFRKLDAAGEAEFKKAAREQYELFTEIKGVWHPIYQMECALMNHRAADYTEEREIPFPK